MILSSFIIWPFQSIRSLLPKIQTPSSWPKGGSLLYTRYSNSDDKKNFFFLPFDLFLLSLGKGQALPSILSSKCQSQTFHITWGSA